MFSSVGQHLRSNVVAYLALFVALTGTAYAADKIGSKDIRKGAVKSKQIGDGQIRSKDIKDQKGVRSVDVRDESLTGADVNEASLGQVPRAGTAESAGTADLADTANLALALQGFDPSQVLGSDRILYGRGPSEADEALLIEWPEAGIEVRTHDADAEDAVFNVRILNTNPAGGSTFYIVEGSSAASLAPGGNKKTGGLIGFDGLLVESKGGIGRMLRLTCFANVIAGGDDGFVQCMGVTDGR
ncbi:MAG: hypothetical protein ACERKT_09195 [Acidobacteriota bacterium]